MSGDSDSKLGHDPLEWLQDDEAESEVENDLSGHQSAEVEAPASDQMAHTNEVPAVTSQDNGESSTDLVVDGVLTLPEKLSIQFVESLYQQWQTVVQSGPSQLQIDAKELLDADAAGVQMLYAFIKQLVSQGCNVQLVNTSSHINKIFGFAGLTDFFEGFVNVA